MALPAEHTTDSEDRHWGHIWFGYHVSALYQDIIRQRSLLKYTLCSDIIIGLVRVGFVHLTDTEDMTYSGYWITMWSMLEPLIAVVVANCMTFRPLLQQSARTLQGLYTRSSRDTDPQGKDSFVRLGDKEVFEMSTISTTLSANNLGERPPI